MNNTRIEKKVGLLGGTFNPIHKGHLSIARAALSEYDLDEIWFIPNGCPPHKSIDNDITALSRYNMVKETISSEPYYIISDIELNSDDLSYTYLTLTKLKNMYSDYSFYFIIGEDSLSKFDTWRRPDIIADCAKIIVAPRSNDKSRLIDMIDSYKKRYGDKFLLLDSEYLDISSTDLRERLLGSEDVSDVIDKRCLSYIRRHYLYEDIDMSGYTPLEEIRDGLQATLKKERFEHTIGVMHTAINLGMRYDVPLHLCRLSGLLHDAAKSYTSDELVEFCEDKGIEITTSQYLAPHLLHGKVGAYIAKNTYHISDERILDAIIYHTTGRPAMSLLEQIVFVADYIEPRRHKASRLSEIRAMAYYNLDIATAMILKDTISYLRDKDAYIDDMTIKTCEYYEQKVRQGEKFEIAQNSGCQ